MTMVTTSATRLKRREMVAEVGKMKVARGGPGVSVVTLADVLESATDCVKVDAKV
mgnify:CR=1 FL=1